MNRWLVSFIICVFGVGCTAIFTSNIGWVLVDIVEHYLTTQIIPGVGLLQCIALGWQFEIGPTSERSAGHKKALRYLGLVYWSGLIVAALTFGFGIPQFHIFA